MPAMERSMVRPVRLRSGQASSPRTGALGEGIALVEIDWELILVLLSSVALMSLAQRLVLPRLRNLL